MQSETPSSRLFPSSLSREAAASRYRRLSLLVHPDKVVGGDPRDFLALKDKFDQYNTTKDKEDIEHAETNAQNFQQETRAKAQRAPAHPPHDPAKGNAHAKREQDRAKPERSHAHKRARTDPACPTPEQKERRQHMVVSSCMMAWFAGDGDWLDEYEFKRRVQLLGAKVSKTSKGVTHLVYGGRAEGSKAVQAAEKIKQQTGRAVVVVHESDLKRLIENC